MNTDKHGFDEWLMVAASVSDWTNFHSLTLVATGCLSRVHLRPFLVSN